MSPLLVTGLFAAVATGLPGAPMAGAPPATVAAPAPATRETLVVLDLRAERGIDEGVVRLLNELLLTEFMRANVYHVMGGSDLQAILRQAETAQRAGCDSEQCLAEVGLALGADLLAVSAIGRIGDYYLLNVKILNVRTATVVSRWSSQVEGLENRLMGAVHEVVGALTGQASAPPPAEVLGLSPWPWIASGVAGAAAATGVVLGSLVAPELGVSPFDPAYSSRRSRAHAYGLAANVSFGTGAAAAVIAAVLFFVELSSSPEPAPATGVGVGRAGLSITF